MISTWLNSTLHLTVYHTTCWKLAEPAKGVCIESGSMSCGISGGGSGGRLGSRLGGGLGFELEVDWKWGGFRVDLKGFGGGADCLDFLLVITDSTDSNVFLLLLESDDTSWGWGIWWKLELARLWKILRFPVWNVILQLWVI